MIRRPPRSTLFPTRRSSDLVRHAGSLAGRGNPHRPRHLRRARLHFLPAAGGACRVDRRTLHRSEEHTSELQSQSNLVCRLLLEKKKKKTKQNNITTTYIIYH